MEQPAYSGGGDGYGVALYDGARFCSVTNSYFDGTRHAVLEFKGACNNLIGGNISANCLNSDFDAHGGGELGSVYIGNVARWGPEKAADVDVKAAFRVGNPVHLAGGSKILFLGNRAEGFPSEDQAFDIQAPCSHVSIIANHALNCGVFARIRYNNRGDAGDAPTQAKMQALAISDILLSGNHFVGPGSERFLDVDGGPLRAVSRVSSLGNIINGVTNARQQYYVRRADRVTLLDDASLHTLPGAANTLMWFDDVTNLVALRQTIIGADRAVRAVNCPGAVFDGFTMKGVASGHVFVDGGGNAGLRFTDYKAISFAPTTLDTAVSAGRVIRRALLDDSAAGARASLGAQEATPFLAGLAALAVTNNRYPYMDFAGNWQLGTTTTFGRSLMSASDAAAGRTALGLATNPALWMTYGGTANAIALTSGAGITGTPPAGLMLRFRATAANSGAASIALDGGAAIACRTLSGAVLPAGYIRTDTETRAHFDGTFWLLERQAESLTNANGRYLRLADGTQECAHSVNLPYGSANTCQADWTFPAAFASSVVTVIMTLKSRAAAAPFPGELAAPRADPVTATQATLRQPNIVGMTAFAPGDVVAMHAFATGTWY
ncbi:hypothetical protein GEU84_020755 [Fertoebacter nigrum]|uniref:Uncharacterized protein n=1 Tax=Fertoeibacter niger TaxID=2656921 RepID=A0A8X8GYU4_9RHOB|nr:hypothetical protein [Fertoeibacter niger]